VVVTDDVVELEVLALEALGNARVCQIPNFVTQTDVFLRIVEVDQQLLRLLTHHIQLFLQVSLVHLVRRVGITVHVLLAVLN